MNGWMLVALLLVGCAKPANEPAPVYSVTDDIEEVYGIYCPENAVYCPEQGVYCPENPQGEKPEQGKCP